MEKGARRVRKDFKSSSSQRVHEILKSSQPGCYLVKEIPQWSGWNVYHSWLPKGDRQGTLGVYPRKLATWGPRRKGMWFFQAVQDCPPSGQGGACRGASGSNKLIRMPIPLLLNKVWTFKIQMGDWGIQEHDLLWVAKGQDKVPTTLHATPDLDKRKPSVPGPGAAAKKMQCLPQPTPWAITEPRSSPPVPCHQVGMLKLAMHETNPWRECNSGTPFLEHRVLLCSRGGSVVKNPTASTIYNS